MAEGMLAKVAGMINQGFAGLGTRGSASTTRARMEQEERSRKPYTPNTDEQRVLGLISEAKQTRQTTLEAYEAIWSRCILYCAGVQHLQYISTTRNFEPTKEDDWMPMPVHNFIQPKVQRIVDMFTRSQPTIYVEPSSRNMDDVNAADLGSKVAQGINDKNRMKDKWDLAVSWAATTGNAFSKTFIDTTNRLARYTPRYKQVEEPVRDPDGQIKINTNTGRPVTTMRWVEERNELDGSIVYDERVEGDVRTDIEGPLGMTVPMAATLWDDLPWVMQTQLFSSLLLKGLFPDKADYIPKTGSMVTSDLYQYRITSLLTSGLHGVVRTLDPWSMRGFVIVNQYERRPDKHHPNGIMVIECEGIPLYIGDLDGNDFSYQHFGYYRVPGRFWHRGVVEDMIPVQDQINKLEQFLQLNDFHNVNPRTLIPTEAEIAPGAMTNRPGANIEYQWPFKPEILQGVTMPPEIVQRRQLYIQDLEDISGVRNVLMGDAPPNVSAGVALNRLGEEAEGLFSPIQKRFETFVERTGTRQLELAQKYYQDPRYFAIQNDMGTYEEVKDFVGADLRGNTRIRVEAGSYKARSKAGQQQQLLDLLAQGLLPGVLGDPDQARTFLKQFGFAEFAPPQSLDAKRAEWENQMLIRSVGWERIERHPGDDDAIHMEMHTRFMKTDAWLHLPQAVQQRCLMHQIEHLDSLAQTGGQPITTGTEDQAMMQGTEQSGDQGAVPPSTDSGQSQGGPNG